MSESATVAPPRAIAVGVRLRALRRARRLTLRDVATRTALSESFLSQLERGRTGASIASLQLIAAALGLEVSDLFAADGPEQSLVLRRGARGYVSFGERARKTLLTPKPFESVEAVLAEFEPGGSTGAEPYRHGDSEELLLVLSGAVDLELDGVEHRLEAGDGARYRSSTPHRVANGGPGPAEVLFVISPPSF